MLSMDKKACFPWKSLSCGWPPLHVVKPTVDTRGVGFVLVSELCHVTRMVGFDVDWCTPFPSAFFRFTPRDLSCLLPAGFPMACFVAGAPVMERNDGPGVLILSEFAGSAQSLSGAIRVNPWNTEELASAMHQALTLSRVERQLRQHKLYR